MAVEYSRGLLLAEGVTGRPISELEQALESSRIVVSLDPAFPASILTVRVLLTTLRRGPGELLLERSGLTSRVIDELMAAVHAIDPERPLAVVAHAGGDATVRLHVGPTAGTATRIVPEAYGAHVAGQRSAVIRPKRPGNAVGAVYAAALGAAEAFKRAARVLPERRVFHRHLRFCPVTLSPDLSAAPDPPRELLFDLALVGVGAIGTGIVLLLDALGAEGRLLAVDCQRYAPENRGTYSLGGVAEVRGAPWKVELARASLPRFDVTALRERVENLPAAIDAGLVPWFRVVLTALDTPEARRAAQRLWPDHLIDAATGDTMLGVHDCVYGSGRCLYCFFPPDHGGPSSAKRLAQVTGLSVERIMRGDDPLTEEDLATVTTEQREAMETFLGKPVCGLAQAFGLTQLAAAAYQPSIPFVSLQSACLAIGRLLASILGMHIAGNFVQYDGLWGPQSANVDQMEPRPDCICHARARAIERVRARRRTGVSSEYT